MRKNIGLGIGILLLGAGLGAAWVYREELAFLRKLLQAYRTGRSFYRDYEHLARDIAFDPEMEPRLDVYSPPGGENQPVVIFLHGGAWRQYDKNLFAPVAMKLLPEELVVVIPDYTLYPDAGYEQMAGEVAAAIAWTLDNIQDYGGDPEQVVVAGHSAGAHLGALALMDPRFLGARSAQVCGFAGLSGVYDVQAEYDYWKAKGPEPRLITGVMGGPQNFERASPRSHVRGDLPPTLLIHGALDESVPVAIARDFYDALRAAGAPAELKIYPKAAHSDYLFEALADGGSTLVSGPADGGSTLVSGPADGGSGLVADLADGGSTLVSGPADGGSTLVADLVAFVRACGP
jgi:acetyl esterase/lipase